MMYRLTFVCLLVILGVTVMVQAAPIPVPTTPAATPTATRTATPAGTPTATPAGTPVTDRHR